MNFKKKICNVFYGLLIVIAAFLLSLTHHLKSHFNSTYFEQLLYNLLNTTTLDLESLHNSISIVFWGMIILACVFFIPVFLSLFLPLKKKITVFKRKFVIFPISLKCFSITIFLLSFFIICIQVGVPNFIRNAFASSSLYEDYYVAYEKENVKFPSQKRNLITIYVESFETSNFSKENGGTVNTSYAPNLEQLANQYINFSNTSLLGGFQEVNGTDWTVAGMVAQTSGIPIYIRTKNQDNLFLEGATSLGDILLENGYRNYLMIGSDASFGERKTYFSEHGNYSIYDYNSARNNRDIDYNYYVWWGYEDRKLYELSKQKLTNIAKDSSPFNFTILTADTHFFDGFVDSKCPKAFDNQYANSFYCMDSMLFDFLNWIQEQDFYDNTTIVITGDHLAMRDDFYSTDKDYVRTGFNLFIHSAIDPVHTKNRVFTAFDMFPTTLASIGVTIRGDRLALGTNLFSGTPTLSEEIGYEEFSKQIQRKSKYYQENILKER